MVDFTISPKTSLHCCVQTNEKKAKAFMPFRETEPFKFEPVRFLIFFSEVPFLSAVVSLSGDGQSPQLLVTDFMNELSLFTHR